MIYRSQLEHTRLWGYPYAPRQFRPDSHSVNFANFDDQTAGGAKYDPHARAHTYSGSRYRPAGGVCLLLQMLLCTTCILLQSLLLEFSSCFPPVDHTLLLLRQADARVPSIALPGLGRALLPGCRALELYMHL